MPHAFYPCSHAYIVRARISSGTAGKLEGRFQKMPATPVWDAPTPHVHGIPIGACHVHAMMQKLERFACYYMKMSMLSHAQVWLRMPPRAVELHIWHK